MTPSTTIERDGLFRADCPYVAGSPSVALSWESVGFVHWSFDPDLVAPLLPDNLQLDVYGGRAWVGYQFLTVAPSHSTRIRRLPGRFVERTSFNEMRLRVCVVDENGLPGVHYFSVDIDRRSVVRWQRRVLNLPAFHAELKYELLVDHGVAQEGTERGEVEYRSIRSDGTEAHLEMLISSTPADTDIDHFLTARWRVQLPARFWDDTEGGYENRWIVTEHARWPLRRCSTVRVDPDALITAGLPAPSGAPHAHWSPGVEVRVSSPRRSVGV